MSTASDIATLKAQVAALQAAAATLQQRCTRLENDLREAKSQLARVRKG